MFKSVRRLHFIKGLTNDGIIFSSGNSNWIQTFRRCSGLMKTKKAVGEVSDDDLTFTAFLHQRQQEARRSVIIQVSDEEVWDDLCNLCKDCDYFKRTIEYKEQGVPFVLIEMSSEEKLHDFLKKNYKLRSDFEFSNPFIKLKEPTSSSGKAHAKQKLHLNSKGSINATQTKVGSKISDCVTDSLSKIYTDLSLNDLGVRLRFLMCRQMENFCASFLPNPIAYPFGSSVTGFGVNGCDLDIALVSLPVESIFFYQENYLNKHRLTVQEHITVLAELMKLFLVGCSGLTLIRNAKVPIVKYKNSFTNVECDLSLYNLHGVVMSQLLYTLSSIDYRVRPLVLAIKLWAYNCGLVNKTPGRTVSNFALSLLAVFFLQHSNLLPPWSHFPQSDGFLINEDNFKAFVEKYRKKAKQDSRSLGELYHSFFRFYAGFDFQKYGICVRSGKFIKNNRKYPLYIENPLIKGLNVSSNVDHDEVQKLHITFNAVNSTIQKSDSFFNPKGIFQQERI